MRQGLFSVYNPDRAGLFGSGKGVQLLQAVLHPLPSGLHNTPCLLVWIYMITGIPVELFVRVAGLLALHHLKRG